MQNLAPSRDVLHRLFECRASFVHKLSMRTACPCNAPSVNGRLSYTRDKQYTYAVRRHFNKIPALPTPQQCNNKNCVQNLLVHRSNCQTHRLINTTSGNGTANKENVSVTPRDVLEYIDCNNSNVLDMIKDDFLVYDDFITEEEETSILEEIEPYLKRLKYEYNHWDDAIHGFRETERKKWTQKNKGIIQRVRDLAFPPGVQQLAYVHILDIKKAGYIKAHVDAVRFCGNTVSGISLLSSAVMRLVHTENKDWYADALLKRRSLYIMRDVARYKFTHEVLGEECSKFKGEVVPRDRRISVICRNEPSPEDRQ